MARKDFDIAQVIGNQVQKERSIDVITEEILYYKDQAGSAILQIGRRLIEAKEKLDHGDWLPWLEQKVEFSERQAQNFMRLAREYPNPQPVADLGARKALALLAVAPEDRDAFLNEPHDLSSAGGVPGRHTPAGHSVSAAALPQVHRLQHHGHRDRAGIDQKAAALAGSIFQVQCMETLCVFADRPRQGGRRSVHPGNHEKMNGGDSNG